MSEIDIDSILSLSSLSIPDEKKAAFNEQLTAILSYMDVLNNVEQTPNPDFEWPIHKESLIREDVPVSFEHSIIEKNAPEFRDHSFVVPKIGS